MLTLIERLNHEVPDAISYPKLYLETPYSCLYTYQNISSMAQSFIQQILCYAISSSDPITPETRYPSLPFNPVSIVTEASRAQLATAIRQLADLHILIIEKDKTQYDIVFFRNLFAALNNLPFITTTEYTAEHIKQHTINIFSSIAKVKFSDKFLRKYSNYCEENPASKFKRTLDSIMDISTKKSGKRQDENEEKKLARLKSIFSLLSLIDPRINPKTEQSQSSLTENGCRLILGSDSNQLFLIIYQFLSRFVCAGRGNFAKFREFYTETEKHMMQKDHESKWLCDEFNKLNTTSYATHVVGLIMNLCCLDILILYNLDTSLFKYYCLFFYWIHAFGLILFNNVKAEVYSVIISPSLYNLKEKYIAHKALANVFYNPAIEYYQKNKISLSQSCLPQEFQGDAGVGVNEYLEEDASLLKNYSITESTGRIFVYKTANESCNERNRNIMRILCNEPKHSFPHVDIYELDPQNFKAGLASATASFLQKTARSVIAKDKSTRGELVVPPTLVNQLEFLKQKMSSTDILNAAPHVKVYQFQYMTHEAVRRRFNSYGEAIAEFSYNIEKCSALVYYRAVTIAEELGCLIWKHNAAFLAMRSRCNILLASSYYHSPTAKFLSLQGDVQRTIRSLWRKIAASYPTEENDNIQGLWLLIHASFQEVFEREFNSEMERISHEWLPV